MSPRNIEDGSYPISTLTVRRLTTERQDYCTYVCIHRGSTGTNHQESIEGHKCMLCGALQHNASVHELVRRREIFKCRALDDNITYSIRTSDTSLTPVQELMLPRSEHRLARTNDSDSTCTLMRTRSFSLTAFIVNVIRLKPASVYRHKCSAYLYDAIGSTITEPNVECR